MGYGLKACERISPQQGVISTVERGHLEGYFFGPIVLRCAEYHVERVFSRASRLLTGNNSSEGRITLLDAAPVYFHFIECVLVDEVWSAAAVHEHFSEPKSIHNWIEDQGGWCSDWPEFWFVTSIESYGRVVPGVYSCDLADFSEVMEGPFAPIV